MSPSAERCPQRACGCADCPLSATYSQVGNAWSCTVVRFARCGLLGFRDYRMPSLPSSALPIATRFGKSVAAPGISIFNEKAVSLLFSSTHPVHQPILGLLDV